MKTQIRLLAVLFCLLVACAAFGQRGAGRQGGRRNNFSIAGLLSRADVQTDIALTPDEKTKIDALRETIRSERQAQPQGGGGTPPTPEERAARQARQQEQEKQYEAILTSDQVKRLHEIQIQLAGPQAVAMKNVQGELGLSSDQIKQIGDLMKQFRDANTSIGDKVRNNEIDQAQARTNRETNLSVLRTNLDKVLTPEQASKLKAMGGRPFQAEAPANAN